MSTIVQQVAAKALIVNKLGQVLIVREATTGKNNTKVGLFGIVGGRLDPGESFEKGLKREVAEETGLSVTIGKPIYLGEWRPIIHGIHHQIIAVFVRCEVADTAITLSSEHDEYAWINPLERTKYPMMEPDCYAVDALIKS